MCAVYYLIYLDINKSYIFNCNIIDISFFNLFCKIMNIKNKINLYLLLINNTNCFDSSNCHTLIFIYLCIYNYYYLNIEY